MTFTRKLFKPARALGLVLVMVVSVIPFAGSSLPKLPDAGKVDQIGAFTDAAGSEALKKTLEPKGYRVTEADGNVHCEIWLRASIANGKNDAQGAAYTRISDSALIAVITFPKATRDFRRQPLKAGTYTLRYAVHPQDGNHIGISPIRDFLLLVPIADDQNPETKFSFEDLSKLSKKASGTNHPAPLSLVSAEGITTWPSVLEDENGHLVFAGKLKTDGAVELPIAFVIKGVVLEQ